MPSSIAAQLVAVNESVRSMPSMTLLQNRLGRVHELQTEAIHGPWSGHHICSNIDAQYWVLPSRRLAEYVAIKEVLAQWTPRTIEVSILATQAAANSLLAANTIGILPERVRQQAAVEPLDCVGTLINTLVALNTTLVRLEPAAVTLVRRLGSLSAALRALTDPVGESLRPLIAQEIQRALDELSDEHRMMIVLADIEELSYQEIANIIGCPIGTVMSRLHRARKHMQSRLIDMATDMGIVDEGKPRKAFNMALKCFIKAFIGPYKRLMRGLIMTFIRAL